MKQFAFVVIIRGISYTNSTLKVQLAKIKVACILLALLVILSHLGFLTYRNMITTASSYLFLTIGYLTTCFPITNFIQSNNLQIHQIKYHKYYIYRIYFCIISRDDRTSVFQVKTNNVRKSQFNDFMYQSQSKTLRPEI